MLSLSFSLGNIKVPIPGNTTFISYKTSLQDYCTKVGWMPPVYNTSAYGTLGHISKVSFGGNTFGETNVSSVTKQEAEQRAAYYALCALGVINDQDYKGDGMFFS